MMNEILISPVANGYVVTLPRTISAEMRGFSEMAPILGRAMRHMDKDNVPGLEDPEEEMHEPDPVIKTDQHVWIFKTFKEVMNFLKFKFDGLA